MKKTYLTPAIEINIVNTDTRLLANSIPTTTEYADPDYEGGGDAKSQNGLWFDVEW